MMLTPDQIRDVGPEALEKVRAELARRSFAEYVKQAWPIIEPGTPLVWGWVIDAICEHLEACNNGQIKRLVINVPPGPMRDDSLVTTSSGRKLLRDVKVGDMVLTHKGRYRPVSAVHHQGVLPILRITTNSGRVTHAAPSHPYLTPRGWVEAGKLRVGDMVVRVTPRRPQQEDEIVEISQVENANCMCLTVEEDHSFVCSDIAVKNSMKSKLTSVLWPTWCWTNQGHLKFLSSSYALNLAERNNVEARRILQSEWYTKTFGVGISAEEGGKVNFSNDKHGVMRAISVGGATTGYRGDKFVIDDPHDVSKAESDAKRTEAVQWFMESAQNRLNSLVDSVIVVVMQRVHEEDVSSIALEMGYDHLCIPMRWEEELRKYTTIGWTDPRTEDGELMWEERFPKKELDQLEKNMGAYATAAQNQQRPAPRKGGMFAVDNIEQIDELPDEPFIEVRAWDFAGSGGTGAYSAGVKMLYGLRSKEFIIADVRRGQWTGGKVREKVQKAAEDDGVACGIMIPQDPGSAGKVQAEDYVAMLTGYNARIEVQSGSKEIRAEPFSAQVEVHRVKILKRLWTKPFLDELRFFPKAKLKDQVDAAASAFNRLAVLTRRDRAKPKLAVVGEKQENTARSV